jgi:post-segregation antitoxin (ccd killing protein)
MPPAKRVTVTLRSDLLEEIDRVERNRSRFISQAVEHELQRRRREALLQSVLNPHPETAELADVGIGEWVKDLPEEDDLVDLSAGTAVRWIEGRGWVEDTQ